MKALQGLVAPLRLQRSMLCGFFDELEKSPAASMALAMFDELIKQVEATIDLVTNIQCPADLKGKDRVLVDETKLAPVLGKPVLKQIESLQDLSSLVVQQICEGADDILNEARAELGLPALKAGNRDDKRNAREETRAEVKAHGREYVASALRDYACSLETALETLQNFLVGAALLAISQQMPQQDSEKK